MCVGSEGLVVYAPSSQLQSSDSRNAFCGATHSNLRAAINDAARAHSRRFLVGLLAHACHRPCQAFSQGGPTQQAAGRGTGRKRKIRRKKANPSLNIKTKNRQLYWLLISIRRTFKYFFHVHYTGERYIMYLS